MFPNIEAERAHFGMSKVELAQELGVSYSTFKSWMREKTEMPCSKVIAMSRLFNVTSDYLMGISQADPHKDTTTKGA